MNEKLEQYIETQRKGLEKFIKVKNLDEKQAKKHWDNLEQKKQTMIKMQEYDEKKKNKIAEMMIPKEELVNGAYYKGHTYRLANVAKWETEKGKFILLRYKFGFRVEEVEHFADVIDGRFDGFAPFEIIEDINVDDLIK